MGKSKGKERNSTEYYKSIIRSLKKQVKTLQQQVNKSTNNFSDDSIKDESNENLDTPKFEWCKHCGKGHVKELIMANRLFIICTICDYRSRAAKIDKDKP
jgi:hypothetical protein